MEDDNVGSSEPLRMLVGGGPGVGKSYVCKAMQSLFDALGWCHTVEYLFAAQQASVANQIRGTTLHRGAHVNARNPAIRGQKGREKFGERIRQTRWIIIDEISQVGAELLHHCEAHFRDDMQGAGGKVLSTKAAPSELL